MAKLGAWLRVSVLRRQTALHKGRHETLPGSDSEMRARNHEPRAVGRQRLQPPAPPRWQSWEQRHQKSALRHVRQFGSMEDGSRKS